jgi:Rps23 Pro-64 3,4-dihydroxylase Tpa1-like proline 4-hydroxylase
MGQALEKPALFLKKLYAIFKSVIHKKGLQFRKYMATRGIPSVPSPPVWALPEDFSVRSIGNTGVKAIDNFLSAEEAQEIIKLYGQEVSRSTVIGLKNDSITHEYRTSSDVNIVLDSSPLVKSIFYRAATLFGLPVSHAEIFSLTRYQCGEYYKGHFDHDGSIKADRLYTMLIYLNSLSREEGGGTWFEKLNFVAQPVCGRAIVWNNSDLNRVRLDESYHSALPVLKEGAEKWVAQVWFRSYRQNRSKPEPRGAPPAGIPLAASEALPPGVHIPDRLVSEQD